MSLGLTLALDGSTYAGSVALIRERDVIAERHLAAVPHPGKSGKAENFMPMVAECLRDGQVRASDLARVVCGEGPGSFTSLRVAASIANGLAVGAGIPLYSVSSLLLIVARGSHAAMDCGWLRYPLCRKKFLPSCSRSRIRSFAKYRLRESFARRNSKKRPRKLELV